MVSNPSDSHARGWREHLAIAAISCAILLFEILITRILSVVLFYHFAFLSISLALLGLGAPGVWYALRPPTSRSLSITLLASAALLPLTVILIIHAGAPFKASPVLWVLALILPMLALGSGICILLLRASGKHIGWMYGADLAGAALGAALVVPLLHGYPTPIVVAALGLLPLLALVILREIRVAIPLAVAAAIVATLIWGQPYRLRYNKIYTETQNPVYEKWTPTARITIFPRNVARATDAFVGWGLGSRYIHHPHQHLWLDQDGSAGRGSLCPLGEQSLHHRGLSALFGSTRTQWRTIGEPLEPRPRESRSRTPGCARRGGAQGE